MRLAGCLFRSPFVLDSSHGVLSRGNGPAPLPLAILDGGFFGVIARLALVASTAHQLAVFVEQGVFWFRFAKITVRVWCLEVETLELIFCHFAPSTFTAVTFRLSCY